jgi:hypothetical protein
MITASLAPLVMPAHHPLHTICITPSMPSEETTVNDDLSKSQAEARSSKLTVHKFSGADWTTFNLPTKWPRRDRCLLYGHNDLQLAKPYFFPILLQTLSFVIFLIQVS